MAVTQADVAARAGVSAKTVSNVVNNYPHVRPEVTDRVNSAITELGYTPSHAARSLRLGRSRVIQLVVPELDVPYFAELARGVIQCADERGLTVIVVQTLGDLQRERDALEGRSGDYAEGTILSPLGTAASIQTHARPKAPVVLIGEPSPNHAYDHVGIDNVAGARAATEHLIDIGRRRIAFIGKQEGHQLPMADERHEGYLAALRAANLPNGEEYQKVTGAYHRADGATALRELATLQEPPDAVFCATDLLALGAMRAAYELGLEIPRDLAVVGFDDLEEGRFYVPSLTTISPDKASIARLAVERLVSQIDGSTVDGRTVDVVVPHALQRRESTIGR